MLEMIEDRKGSAVLEEKRDILSNLIKASMGEAAPRKDFDFTHRDLLGNIFAFLVAGKLSHFVTDFPLSLGRGHETTASVLCFAVSLLATHPEEQEELYKHVRSVIPDGRLPVRRSTLHYCLLTMVYQAYQDVPKLTRVLAVINETLRLFPPVSSVSDSSTSGYCNIYIGC
jgi:cytochrome P450